MAHGPTKLRSQTPRPNSTTMAHSYLHYRARFDRMTAEERHGHLVTLEDNLKRRVVTPVFAAALRDAHAQAPPPPPPARRLAPKDDDDDDPRILAGTHVRVVEMQKCGGKGQRVRVETVVPAE